MLVVKVELWPNGSQSKAREIGRMEIAHVGGDLAVGEYRVEVPAGRDWCGRQGEVNGHDRLLPIWWLVAKALKSVGFGG